MKTLDRLILKSFLGPLLLTFSIATFVLLMQFVWKYIDDMVGKGLPFSVLAELMAYASATFVPMALPIAILFASIMTMGSFGERYELVAMKAGGVSIWRVMMPLALVALLLTGVAFYFTNNVLPVAMLRYKMVLFDVTSKKPALNIKPSEYYTDIEGYVIRANEKDPEDGTLRDIVIYDNTHRATGTTIVAADSGRMATSPDERYLILTLYHGNTYREETEGEKYRTRPFTALGFQEQVMTFDLSSFAFNKTDGDFFKGNYQMMNIAQLKESIADLEKGKSGHYSQFRESITDRLRGLKTIRPAVGKTLKKATENALRDSTRQAEQQATPAALAELGEEQRREQTKKDSMSNLLRMTIITALGQRPEDQDRDRKVNTNVLEATSADTLALRCQDIPVYSAKVLETLTPEERANVTHKACENMRACQNEIRMYKDMLHADEEYINRHYIEWQRKYTLSIACLVLFLVGAPFGSIVRKGGLGLPLVASVLFFVFYYMIGMIAEKSVREGVLGFEGMWVSTFMMLPIGIVLTWYATGDGRFFRHRRPRKIFRKSKTGG